jgi:hypothetical protein
MKRNYDIKRKLRSATKEDVDNNENLLFYFQEGAHTSRIKRMMPEDYNNWKWIKDSGEKKKFKDSCRKDWEDVTDQLLTLLMEDNLFIKKYGEN